MDIEKTLPGGLVRANTRGASPHTVVACTPLYDPGANRSYFKGVSHDFGPVGGCVWGGGIFSGPGSCPNSAAEYSKYQELPTDRITHQITSRTGGDIRT